MNIEKLKELAEQHALWKKWRTSGQAIEQQGVQLIVTNDSIIGGDLSKQDLAGAEFHEVDLTNVSFSGTNLNGAFFKQCNLSNCNFENADLSKASFYRCTIANSNFEQSRCYKCEFDESPMKNIVFRNANLQYAEFSNLVLEDVDFSGADCHHLFLFSSRLVRCIGKNLKKSHSIILENTTIEPIDEAGGFLKRLEYATPNGMEAIAA
ncbi:pentapeptide repeat-containing protein [candidate division KSB1 bacterium]|nr:pentapeptide repeat-containing protein [candidate division KSB1 bacterium]